VVCCLSGCNTVKRLIPDLCLQCVCKDHKLRGELLIAGTWFVSGSQLSGI